jgi:acetylornithine/succinyldiaminopimelate/putrescine aminotransferase
MLASVAGKNVIRLAPPLNVSADEIDEALSRLGALLEEIPT